MRNRKRLITLFILLVSLLVAVSVQAAEKYKGYPKGHIFIAPQELKALMDAKDPKLVVIAVANKPAYLLGHIPGSFQLWRPDYEAPPDTQGGVTDNIASPEAYAKLMQGLGINADSKVVVYDHQYDATRLWWAFYYYGKTDVRILDGGINGWKAAGFGTEMIPSARAARQGTWVAKAPNSAMLINTADVVAAKDNPNVQLWDNRNNKQVRGEEIQKGAYRAGRIPWSVQSDWVHVKTKANDAEWVTADEARSAFEKFGYDPGKTQYFYCQSGVRTTQMISTLYALGWPMEKLKNYDSSWIGWSKDDKLPIETGWPPQTKAPWQK